MSADELSNAPGTPSVPSFDALMWPTLEALKAMGGSGTNEELLTKVIEVANIPPDVQAVQHTDHRQTKLNYNLAWAKTYLKKVGAIDNSSRGVWSITKLGETLTPADVRSVPSRVRKQVSEDRRAREPPKPAQDVLELESGEGVETVNTYWKDELLAVVRALTPTHSSDLHNAC
jgi:restriction system protein